MKAPDIAEKTRAFHGEQIVIDLHVDCVIQQRLFRYDIRKFHRPWLRRQPFFRHADIPRMIEGGYTAAVLGIHYWRKERERGWQEVNKQLDYMHQVVEADERVVLARTADDIVQAKKDGKLALLAGLEGAHLLNANLDRVDEVAARGAIYITLAHFHKNSAATPGMGRGKNHTDGLSPFGRDLVRKMNAAKVLVDAAHVNRPGVLEICDLTTAPVIASHTMAVSLQENNRGLTDDGIRAIADTGGVIGLIFSPDFLKGRFNVSLDAVVDHAVFVADLVGAEHVAIGSDFDGWIPSIPNDIRDCRDIGLLTQKLLDRGMSPDDVGGILGGNFLRVLRKVRG